MAYAYRKKGGKTVYIAFKNERAEVVRRATAARTIQEGRAAAQRLEWQAEQVRFGAADATPERVSFSDFADRYLKEVAATKRSHPSIEARLRVHLVPAFGTMAIQDLGASDIEALLARKAMSTPNEKALGPQSREHLRRTLSAMLNVAMRWGLVRANPAANVPKIKIPTEAIRYFEAEEIPRLLAAVPDRYRCAFAIALFLGARKGEVLGLRVADLDLARRLVTFAHSYDGPTKSGKPRRVPIPAELAPLLAAQIPRGEDGYLFSAEDWRLLARSTALVRILRQAMIAAGIIEGFRHVCRRKSCRYSDRRADEIVTACPKCRFKLYPSPILPYRRFHDLRSTFGTHAYERTGDVRVVQATLGHSTPALTEARYSSLRDRRLLDLADKLTFGVPAPATALPTHPARTQTAIGDDAPDGALEALAILAKTGDPDGFGRE